MNGPHLATGRFETGDVNLSAETSSNFDIGLSYEADNICITNNFRNDTDNYIYLMDMHDEDDHDDHIEAMDEDDHDEDHDVHAEGLITAQYMQQNAELNGYELQVGRVFNLDSGDLEVSFSRDVVNGNLLME